MSTTPSVVPRRLDVVHLGRAGAWGNRNRVQTWQQLGAAAGAQVRTVDLTAQRSGVSDLRRVAGLLNGSVVPEALSWSGRALAQRLTPGATVVFVTARAFDPRLVPTASTVLLDFVDRLSESYRLRTNLASDQLRRLLYSGLRVPMQRFEARARPGVRLAAAGRADAEILGADWLPNLVPDPAPRGSVLATTDLLFHGSLGYAPNVEGVRQLRAIWPALQALRPQTTVTIAGAAPSPALAGLIEATPGWTLHQDFQDLNSLLSSARVAVAPLLSATGLQNKVLESAGAGLPTVVTPEVARGFDPRFPLRVASPDRLASTLAELLEDPSAQRRLGDAAREHIAQHYTVPAWRDRAVHLFGWNGGDDLQ